MTDTGGNSRPSAPVEHDRREREFSTERPAGRAYTVGQAAARIDGAQNAWPIAGGRAFWADELARQAHRRRR